MGMPKAGVSCTPGRATAGSVAPFSPFGGASRAQRIRFGLRLGPQIKPASSACASALRKSTNPGGMPRRLQMSARTFGVAVAVNASTTLDRERFFTR
eukprot:scaffold145_cov261-Pinguiococcus_pyrenoidosus.AAC.16